MNQSISLEQKALILTKLLYDRHSTTYEMLTDEQKHGAFLILLNEITSCIQQSEKPTNGLTWGPVDWIKKAANSVVDAGKSAADWSSKAAEDTYSWTKQAAVDSYDWSKQAAIDTYDWGKEAVNWGACKGCTAAISSVLSMEGATFYINILLFTVLNNEADAKAKEAKIDSLFDDILKYLPSEIKGKSIDRKLRNRIKAAFIYNIQKNPATFYKISKSGLQEIIASTVCEEIGLCNER